MHLKFHKVSAIIVLETRFWNLKIMVDYTRFLILNNWSFGYLFLRWYRLTCFLVFKFLLINFEANLLFFRIKKVDLLNRTLCEHLHPLSRLKWLIWNSYWSRKLFSFLFYVFIIIHQLNDVRNFFLCHLKSNIKDFTLKLVCKTGTQLSLIHYDVCLVIFVRNLVIQSEHFIYICNGVSKNFFKLYFPLLFVVFMA